MDEHWYSQNIKKLVYATVFMYFNNFFLLYTSFLIFKD